MKREKIYVFFFSINCKEVKFYCRNRIIRYSCSTSTSLCVTWKTIKITSFISHSVHFYTPSDVSVFLSFFFLLPLDIGFVAYDGASCCVVTSSNLQSEKSLHHLCEWRATRGALQSKFSLSTFWQVEETSSRPPNEFPLARCLLLATRAPFLLALHTGSGRWRRSSGPGGIEGEGEEVEHEISKEESGRWRWRWSKFVASG